MGVNVIDIANTFFKVIKTIIYLIYYCAKTAILTFFRIIRNIFSYLAFLLPFSPFALVVICVFLIMSILWNEVTKPIIYGILDGYNGVINGWNMVADAVSDIGFDIPGMGHVSLGGIPLNRGNPVNADIPDFWPFILSILIPVVFIPLEKALKGVIIR
jgi:hypothetical protein